MYPMYPMGMGSYYSLNSMYGTNGNVHQNFNARYGVGYEDFGTRPYAQSYPMAITPKRTEPITEQFWIGRFIRKIFS